MASRSHPGGTKREWFPFQGRRESNLLPSAGVPAVEIPLLSDVEDKDRQLATCGGRLDVRGLVCLLPDNRGCHIKMLARSEFPLLQLSVTASRSTKPTHPLLQLISCSIFPFSYYFFPYMSPFLFQIMFYIANITQFGLLCIWLTSRFITLHYILAVSSVDIATRLPGGRPRNRGSSLLHSVQIDMPNFLQNEHRGFVSQG